MTTYELTFRDGKPGGLELNPLGNSEPKQKYKSGDVFGLMKWKTAMEQYQQAEQNRKWVEIDGEEIMCYAEGYGIELLKKSCRIEQGQHFTAETQNGKLINLKAI
jgi:hypothetical protein